MQLGQPVTFAGRAPTLAERKYSQIWKDWWLRSLAWITTTTTIVYVRKVILWTDHKLLVCISWKPLASVFKRLTHLLLRLQQFDCEIHYKPGKEMLLADTLSRAYSEDYERSATESEVECIHTTHSFLFQTTTLQNFRERRLVIQLYSLVKKAILDGFLDTMDEQPAAIHQYRVSSNNSWGQLFLFSHKKGAIIRGKAIIWARQLCQCISNIAHWKSCPKYFVLFSH